MRNDILNTTDLAFKAHAPEWSLKLHEGVKMDILPGGDYGGRDAKVTLTVTDVEHLLATLRDIESKVGKDAVFSNFPIYVATGAWDSLLAEMRRGTISN